MTTGGVFVGATAVYAALRNHTQQINAQIFLAYSDRLQTIRRVMRTDLLPIWSLDIAQVDLPQALPGILEVLHLVLELRELHGQGYIKPQMWAVWSRDIDRFLDAPIVRSARASIASEFVGHTDFVAWVEHRQALLAANAAQAAGDSLSG